MTKKEKSTEMEEEVARSEIQEYLYLRQQRRRLFPLAALVGLLLVLLRFYFEVHWRARMPCEIFC